MMVDWAVATNWSECSVSRLELSVWRSRFSSASGSVLIIAACFYLEIKQRQLRQIKSGYRDRVGGVVGVSVKWRRQSKKKDQILGKNHHCKCMLQKYYQSITTNAMYLLETRKSLFLLFLGFYCLFKVKIKGVTHMYHERRDP